MLPYLAWWIGGAGVGVLAGAWVLRREPRMTWSRAFLLYAVAMTAGFYGAKVQYALRFAPLTEALRVPPRALLEPGYVLPLGLVLGFAAAMLVARACRVSSLRVADALAFTGAVLMPIGRIGCIVAGCCTGMVAPSWWPLGFTYPPNTLPFVQQVALGIVPASASVSLPVHPLPLYFVVLGTTMAAVELVLLLRDAQPGAVAAVGFSVHPLGQLVIERFRTPLDDRGAVMTAILLAMVVGDAVAVAAFRRRAPRRPARLLKASVAMAMVGVALHPLGAAAAPRGDWSEVVTRYMQDPVGQRAAVLALGRRVGDGEPLPPLYRLAIADAHLRAGHLRTAARMFEAIVADDGAGSPWGALATLGRGWTAVARGRLDDARDWFARTADAPGDGGALAAVLVGLIDAGRGDATAAARLARVADDPASTNDLRAAARMGEAYARFWLGDDAGAAAGFARIAAGPDGGVLREEARYGAALVRWRDGDRAGAGRALAQLDVPPHAAATAPPPRGLDRLDPRALVRSSVRRYRRLPFRMPAAQVVALMQLDVGTLARMAGRGVAAGRTAPPPLADRAPGGVPAEAAPRGRQATGASAPAPPAASAPAAESRETVAAASMTVAALVVVILAIAAGAAVRAGAGR